MTDISNESIEGTENAAEDLEVLELRANEAPAQAEDAEAKRAAKEAKKAEKEQKKREKEARKLEKAQQKAEAKRAEAEGEDDGEDEERPKAKESSKPGKDSHKVTFEAEMTPDEATNYLEALLRGVYAGKVHFRQGEGELELSPSGAMNVKVKASRKGPKEKITFELGWRTHSEDDLAID